jgi:hypothetical protein
MLALAWLYYLFALTNGSFNLFVPEPLGSVYEDMAARLANGDFTSDPALVSVEVYVRDGRNYMYFGVLPALLRWPVLAVMPVERFMALPLSRSSCWLALCLAALAQARLLQDVCVRLPVTRLLSVLHVTALGGLLFAGPQIELTFSSYMYNEPIVWGVTATLWFIRASFIAMARHRLMRQRDWALLGVLAGAGLLARPTAGAAMAVGLLAMALVVWVQAARLCGRVTTLLRHPAWAGAATSLVFCAAALTVNWMRWGKPFTFLDLDSFVPFQATPRLVAIAATYGLISPLRLPVSLAYYLFGGPFASVMPGWSDAMIMNWQYPRSIQLATTTVSFVLTAIGVYGALAGRLLGQGYSGSRQFVAAWLIAPIVETGLVLCYGFLMYRYRFEFQPLFAAGTALGFAVLARARRSRSQLIIAGLAILTIINVAVTQLDLLQAKLASFVLTPKQKIEVAQATLPLSRLFVSLEHLRLQLATSDSH